MTRVSNSRSRLQNADSVEPFISHAVQDATSPRHRASVRSVPENRTAIAQGFVRVSMQPSGAHSSGFLGSASSKYSAASGLMTSAEIGESGELSSQSRNRNASRNDSKWHKHVSVCAGAGKSLKFAELITPSVPKLPIMSFIRS